MHLNRDKTRKIHRNSLRNFPLHGFNEHLHWFRFSGKGKHLNPAARQNPAANPLTTNALQDFQQLCPWYRSQAGLECRGMQTCPGGASERLSVTRIQQAPPLVQIQRKREASEPCSKAEYGSQPTHNKYIAGLSKTAPEVQIPGRAGMPRNTNAPWRYF